MSKILSILENTSKSGNKYWEIVCEGVEKKIISFKPFRLGDDLETQGMELNDRGDCYMIKTDNKGGKSYQKNDELIVAQVAYKSLVDLAIAGKVDLFEKNAYRQEALTSLGTQIAFTIRGIAGALKGNLTLPDIKPATKESNKKLTTVGQLFTRANAKWDLYRADILKILGIEDAKEITDLDAAWNKIAEAMEPKDE